MKRKYYGALGSFDYAMKAGCMDVTWSLIRRGKDTAATVGRGRFANRPYN